MASASSWSSACKSVGSSENIWALMALTACPQRGRRSCMEARRSISSCLPKAAPASSSCKISPAFPRGTLSSVHSRYTVRVMGWVAIVRYSRSFSDGESAALWITCRVSDTAWE